MDVHLLTPRGAELVVQVVDGRAIVPPATDCGPLQPVGGADTPETEITI